MENLNVGYGSVIINPEIGTPIFGYYVPRFVKGVLDDLTASALAIKLFAKTIVMVSIDNCGLDKSVVDRITDEVKKNTGIDTENILISCTHTHTAPYAQHSDMFVMDNEMIDRYRSFLTKKVVCAVELAISDLKPARMGYAVGRAPERIAYIRRYKMKDGSTQTCPPINDENIVGPIGELDNRVNVVRFDREGGKSIVVLNYGLHADTIGGELISADFVHWLKKTLDLSLNVECICFMGAQGDVGSTNVFPTKSDMNDTEISFDNEMKSPGMARFVGRALAGTVLQVYDKVKYVPVERLKIQKREIAVAANVPAREDLPRAHEYKRLHDYFGRGENDVMKRLKGIRRKALDERERN